MTTFSYDLSDTRKYPGLTRPWDDAIPYLTPVFFTNAVLVRYFYDPRYRCRFYSETYGSILSRTNGSAVEFGINRNGKVLMWHGDVLKLPDFEQTYLTSENIVSDHLIDSEFYDAQINAEFTAPIREMELIQLKYLVNDSALSKFGLVLFKTAHHNSFESLIDQCSKFKRIVFDSEDDLKLFVNDWNETLVEDIDHDSVKTILDKNEVPYDAKAKGNKTLEKFIQNVLNIKGNLIAPMFHLYDLRIWADHSDAQSMYDGVVSKLGLQSPVTHEAMYGALIESLIDFLETLLSALGSHELET